MKGEKEVLHLKKDDKIIKFQKQFQINIGFVIFGIVLLYVLFHLFSYLTAKHVTVYEVTEGTISKNTTYQALALRQEEVIKSQGSGEIFYFASNLDQVGVRTNIYSIDTTGSITPKLQDKTENLNHISKEDILKLSNKLGEYTTDFQGDNFYKVYNFKTDIASDLHQYYSNNAIQEISGDIDQAISQGTFTYYKASTPGTIVFQTDGMEGISLDTYNKESFNQEQVKLTNLKNNKKIKEGQDVYKLITSDKWNLVLPIDKDLSERIHKEQIEYIEIRFLEDNAKTWCKCYVENKDKQDYLVLELKDGVERYATSRFVPIALLLDEQAGLKIPKSAIVEKEFFAVPKSYFFKGNNSSDPCLYVQNGRKQPQLVVPTIYYEKNKVYYIDAETVSSDDDIVKPDSTTTYRVGTKTAKLRGVYNINKGYAVFKQIDVLFENEDYAIVKIGTSYGIANYDHIALQGDQVKENQLIN